MQTHNHRNRIQKIREQQLPLPRTGRPDALPHLHVHRVAANGPRHGGIQLGKWRLQVHGGVFEGYVNVF